MRKKNGNLCSDCRTIYVQIAFLLEYGTMAQSCIIKAVTGKKLNEVEKVSEWCWRHWFLSAQPKLSGVKPDQYLNA